jgi:hypothetical protein
MAHFAELDSNNIVTQVLVVPNHQENRGQEYLANDLGLGGNWIRTSYNGNIRKNFAGIGYSYWPDLDAFVPPKCHDEAVLDEATARWICNNEAHNPIKEIN